eukprot:5802989-Alexandrium_andersonii.AAC.1
MSVRLQLRRHANAQVRMLTGCFRHGELIPSGVVDRAGIASRVGLCAKVGVVYRGWGCGCGVALSVCALCLGLEAFGSRHCASEHCASEHCAPEHCASSVQGTVLPSTVHWR